MSDANIDTFNRGVVLLFARLYDAFPRPVTVDVAELSVTGPEGVVSAEAELSVLANTLEFLEREGFVQSGGSDDSSRLFSRVVLTAKGLAILTATPDSLKERLTIGQRFVTLAKAGGVEAIRAAGGHFISAELPLLLRSVGL